MKKLFSLFLILGLLLIGNFCSAYVIEDGFETYTVGQPVTSGAGQKWCYSSSGIKVSDSAYSEGTKSLNFNSSGATDNLETQPNGTETSGEFYIDFNTGITTDTKYISVEILNANTNCVSGSSVATINIKGNTSNLKIYENNTTDYVYASLNEWHTLGFKYTASNKFQFNVDGGTWSPEYNYYGSYIPNSIIFRKHGFTTENFYVDNISLTPPFTPASISITDPTNSGTEYFDSYTMSYELNDETATDGGQVWVCGGSSSNCADDCSYVGDCWYDHTVLSGCADSGTNVNATGTTELDIGSLYANGVTAYAKAYLLMDSACSYDLTDIPTSDDLKAISALNTATQNDNSTTTISYPTNSSTTNAEFWTIAYTSNNSYDRVGLSVRYATTQYCAEHVCNSSYTDTEWLNDCDGSFETLSGSTNISRNNNIADGTYYAKAYLIGYSVAECSDNIPNETLIASSPTISFTYTSDYISGLNNADTFWSGSWGDMWGNATTSIAYQGSKTFFDTVTGPILNIMAKWENIFNRENAVDWGVEAGASLKILLQRAADFFNIIPNCHLFVCLLIAIIFDIGIFLFRQGHKILQLIRG